MRAVTAMLCLLVWGLSHLGYSRLAPALFVAVLPAVAYAAVGHASTSNQKSSVEDSTEIEAGALLGEARGQLGVPQQLL